MSYSSIFQVYIWLTILRVMMFLRCIFSSFWKSHKWFHLFGHSWFVKECMFSIRIQCKISTKFLKLWKTTSLFIYLFIIVIFILKQLIGYIMVMLTMHLLFLCRSCLSKILLQLISDPANGYKKTVSTKLKIPQAYFIYLFIFG